jgi:HAMP domain-containing protein
LAGAFLAAGFFAAAFLAGAFFAAFFAVAMQFPFNEAVQERERFNIQAGMERISLEKMLSTLARSIRQARFVVKIFSSK